MNKNIAIITAISPNFQGLQYNWTNWYNHRCFNTLSRILDCWKLLTSRIFFPFTAAVFSCCWLVILSLVPSSKNKMYEILWMTQPLQNLILFHPQKKTNFQGFFCSMFVVIAQTLLNFIVHYKHWTEENGQNWGWKVTLCGRTEVSQGCRWY